VVDVLQAGVLEKSKSDTLPPTFRGK
jgi:hypothetical protein